MKRNSSFDPQVVLQILRTASHPLRLDDILRRASLSRRQKDALKTFLQDEAAAGRLAGLPGGAWALRAKLKKIIGELLVNYSGSSFVRPQGASAQSNADIYIAPENLNNAWHGDLVEVSLLSGRKGRSREGMIVCVVKRARGKLAAIVTVPSNPGLPPNTVLASPDDSRIQADLLVDCSDLPCDISRDIPGALPGLLQVGDILLVEIGQPLPDYRSQPVWSAKALASLGSGEDTRAQELAVKLKRNIPLEFPPEAVAEASKVANIPLEFTPDLEDIRGLPLVTIDGEQARDFDDAVFVEKRGEFWRLVVAIADVAYYVRPGGALDSEALARGNSYYFPTSVEPMLPASLSNGVCSLKPDEDRRALVADLLFDGQGIRQTMRFYNGLMRSRARLTYDQTQAFFDRGIGLADREVGAMLVQARPLAELLIQAREWQGSLDFALPEAEYDIEDNRVTGIHNSRQLFSHRLIEAFMVAANEAVAAWLEAKKRPCLYRVHPSPDPELLEDLRKTLLRLDLDLSVTGKGGRFWLSKILRAANQTDKAWIVSSLALGVMESAAYSPAPAGHYGLASARYCHFTSPIRRYADLIVHRSLRLALGLDNQPLPGEKELYAIAAACNQNEKRADQAEREIASRLGFLLLEGKEGQEFQGIITSFSPHAVWLRLADMPLGGRLLLQNLTQDYFIYNERTKEMRGRNSGQALRLGDIVRLRLLQVDKSRQILDFTLAGQNQNLGRQSKKQRAKAGGSGGKQPCSRKRGGRQERGG